MCRCKKRLLPSRNRPTVGKRRQTARLVRSQVRPFSLPANKGDFSGFSLRPGPLREHTVRDAHWGRSLPGGREARQRPLIFIAPPARRRGNGRQLSRCGRAAEPVQAGAKAHGSSRARGGTAARTRAAQAGAPARWSRALGARCPRGLRTRAVAARSRGRAGPAGGPAGSDPSPVATTTLTGADCTAASAA